MKVNELKEKLSKLKKEEIIKIASEFYKLIPKSKKEDYDLDSYILNPEKTKKKSSIKRSSNLEEIETELKKFIEDVKNQYYAYPNRIVSKKERSTWRFKVKRWYKELINKKRLDKNIEKQAELLSDLYGLICESCGSEYFSAYDSFQSIGIDQDVFYSSVITLLHESRGKAESVKESIGLIVDNYVNRYTLYSDLMGELINTYRIPDLKYRGIKVVEEYIKETNFQSKGTDKKNYFSYSHEEFRKKEKHNNLVELGLRFYLSLTEIEEGVAFYEKYYHDDNKEVKLYILVRILFEERKKEQIVKELEEAIKQGLKPRNNLMNLMSEIKESGELPKYMR